MAALIRVEEEILDLRRGKKSAFVLARIVYRYSRFPPSVRSLVLSRGECFQESCGAYDYVAQTGFRREAMGKVFKSTIHLAQPVWSLRLTWREEFARFLDNESGKLPTGSGRSLDT